MLKGNDRKKPVTQNDFPQELVGMWKVEGLTYQIEITDKSLYKVIGQATYSFVDPSTLKITTETNKIEIYTKIYGEPNSIIGVWWCEEQQLEIIYRDDNTYTITDKDWSDTYFGTYSITETQIETREVRAYLEIDEDRITWLRPFAQANQGTFEIESSERWHYRCDEGWARTYFKI